MKPVLRAAFSPDTSDLESFDPPVDGPWSVFVQLLVGPSDSEGEESFGVTICNGAWLDEKARERPAVVGRHHIIMSEFDWGAARDFVVSYLDRCVGETWQAVAEQVARLGHWEFEDYKP